MAHALFTTVEENFLDGVNDLGRRNGKGAPPASEAGAPFDKKKGRRRVRGAPALFISKTAETFWDAEIFSEQNKGAGEPPHEEAGAHSFSVTPSGSLPIK